MILTTEERELIENAPTTNLKAYDLYLKTLNQKRETKKDFENLIGMYREVIAMDNKFAMAYARLGHNLYKLKHSGATKSIWVDSAMAMLDKSIQLDPAFANTYRYKAFIYKGLHEEEKVKENLFKGLQYDPNSFYILKDLGFYYERMGEYSQALDYMLKSLAINKPDEKYDLYQQMGNIFQKIDRKMLKKYLIEALESNPESINILERLVPLELCDQNYESALQYALKVEDLDFEKNFNYQIAYCYMLINQYSKSDEYFNKRKIILEQENGQYRPNRLHGYVRIKLGKTEEGQAMIIADLDEGLLPSSKYDLESEVGHDTCFRLARKYAWENKNKEAMAWLEKSIENETGWYSLYDMLWLMTDPFFDNLREEEKFKNVVQSFLDEEESRSLLLSEKLAKYHKRNELKWIKQD